MAYPENVARIDWQFTNGVGADCHVVMHSQTTLGAYTAAECEAVAEHCADSWDTSGYLVAGNSVKGQANNQTTLQTVTVTSLAAVAPPQFVRGVGTAGTQPGNAMPPETAIVLTWYTGIVGKSYRGRSYWPGVDFDQLELNGTLTAAYVTASQDLWNAYPLVMGVNTQSYPVVHSPTLLLATPVTSEVTRDTLHHQRRRNS